MPRDATRTLGLRFFSEVDQFLANIEAAEGAVKKYAKTARTAIAGVTAEWRAKERIITRIFGTIRGVLFRSAGYFAKWGAAANAAFLIAYHSANQFQQTLITIGEVAKNVGKSVPQALAIIEKHTDAFASRAQVAEGVMKLLGSSLELPQIDKLIGRIKEGAVAMGYNADQIGLVARGIRQWNVNILDNIGVNFRLDQLVRKLADSFDKAELEITDTEKELAIYNEVIKQTNKFQGVLAAQTEAGTLSFRAFGRVINEVILQLGRRLTPLYNAIVQTATEFVDIFLQALKSGMFERLIKMGEKFGKIVLGAMRKILDILDFILVPLAHVTALFLGLAAPIILSGITLLAAAFTALGVAVSAFATVWGLVSFLAILKWIKDLGVASKDAAKSLGTFQKAGKNFGKLMHTLLIPVKEFDWLMRGMWIYMSRMGKVFLSAMPRPIITFFTSLGVAARSAGAALRAVAWEPAIVFMQRLGAAIHATRQTWRLFLPATVIRMFDKFRITAVSAITGLQAAIQSLGLSKITKSFSGLSTQIAKFIALLKQAAPTIITTGMSRLTAQLAKAGAGTVALTRSFGTWFRNTILGQKLLGRAAETAGKINIKGTKESRAAVESAMQAGQKAFAAAKKSGAGMAASWTAWLKAVKEVSKAGEGSVLLWRGFIGLISPFEYMINLWQGLTGNIVEANTGLGKVIRSSKMLTNLFQNVLSPVLKSIRVILGGMFKIVKGLWSLVGKLFWWILAIQVVVKNILGPLGRILGLWDKSAKRVEKIRKEQEKVRDVLNEEIRQLRVLAGLESERQAETRAEWKEREDLSLQGMTLRGQTDLFKDIERRSGALGFLWDRIVDIGAYLIPGVEHRPFYPGDELEERFASMSLAADQFRKRMVDVIRRVAEFDKQIAGVDFDGAKYVDMVDALMALDNAQLAESEEYLMLMADDMKAQIEHVQELYGDFDELKDELKKYGAEWDRLQDQLMKVREAMRNLKLETILTTQSIETALITAAGIDITPQLELQQHMELVDFYRDSYTEMMKGENATAEVRTKGAEEYIASLTRMLELVGGIRRQYSIRGVPQDVAAGLDALVAQVREELDNVQEELKMLRGIREEELRREERRIIDRLKEIWQEVNRIAKGLLGDYADTTKKFADLTEGILETARKKWEDTATRLFNLMANLDKAALGYQYSEPYRKVVSAAERVRQQFGGPEGGGLVGAIAGVQERGDRAEFRKLKRELIDIQLFKSIEIQRLSAEEFYSEAMRRAGRVDELTESVTQYMNRIKEGEDFGFGAFGDYVNDPLIRQMRGMVTALEELTTTIQETGWEFNIQDQRVHIPPPGMQHGGIVAGTGVGDRVPSMLEPGEYVVRRSATKRFRPLLEMINRGGLRFQGGGEVPPLPRSRMTEIKRLESAFAESLVRIDFGPLELETDVVQVEIDPLRAALDLLLQALGDNQITFQDFLMQLDVTLGTFGKRWEMATFGTQESIAEYQNTLATTIDKLHEYAQNYASEAGQDVFISAQKQFLNEYYGLVREQYSRQAELIERQARLSRPGAVGAALGIEGTELAEIDYQQRLQFIDGEISRHTDLRSEMKEDTAAWHQYNAIVTMLSTQRAEMEIANIQATEDKEKAAMMKRLGLAATIGEALGGIIAAGWAKGGKGIADAMKEALKGALLILLDYLRQQIYIAWLSAAAETIITMGLSAAQLAKVATIEAGYHALKGGILAMAEGGIVTKPTLALIGEAGPEKVIPLDKEEPRSLTVIVPITTDLLIADNESIDRTSEKIVDSIAKKLKDKGVIGQDEKYPNVLVE